MSEIKITKNSIENSIISNGLVTIGSINNADFGNSNIVSNSSGSLAIGYIDGIANDNDGAVISATGLGAFASGYAYIDSTYSEDAQEQIILEYYNVIANGDGAHAEGIGTKAVANGAHAEGYGTYAGMQLLKTDTKAISRYDDWANKIILNLNSAAEFEHRSILINNHIFYVESAEGDTNDIIVLNESISEEDLNWAINNFILLIVNIGDYSHAEGYETVATGDFSHAGGKGTIANREAMTSIGKYNISNSRYANNTLFVVGDGINSVNRSDAFRVNSLGSETGTNSVPSSVQAKVNGVPDVYLGCPIGTIVMWAGNIDPLNDMHVPDGWILCDGSSLDNSGGKYDNLYYVIGTLYGGTGKTSFNLPNLQQRFPIGAEIGGVGNITDKGTLKLYYNGTSANWYYEGTIEIGQFLDLTNVQTILPHTSSYSDYCKIIDILGPNSISVIKCDSSGKTIDNTIENLFRYYLYTVQLGIIIDDIKIKENKYSTILGSVGGEETHKLTKEEMPSHNHLIYNAPAAGSGLDTEAVSPTINLDDTNGRYQNVDGGMQGSHWYTFYAGNNLYHNNIPPFLAINFIIKYK